jgi:hypothetical protein
MTEGTKDQFLFEDDTCPVEVQSEVYDANPSDQHWCLIGASQPSKATYPINHSDITRVLVEVLHPSDSPADGQFVVSRDIPIIIIDSLDKYWASESRSQLPLEGLRVPIAGDTVEDAKRALAIDLAGQFRLLLLLSVSHSSFASTLQVNLDLLHKYMDINPRREIPGG